MTFHEFKSPINFELENVFSWGVIDNKYGGFSVPIKIDEETNNQLLELTEEHMTKNPVYKGTLYLKTKTLSEKQTKELYNKGRTNMLVHFQATGIYTKNAEDYITFKITKLRKLEDDNLVCFKDEVETPED